MFRVLTTVPFMRISSLGTHWKSLWYWELYLLTVCAEGQGRVMRSSLAWLRAWTPPPTPPPTPPAVAAATTLSLRGRVLCTRLSMLAPYTHTLTHIDGVEHPAARHTLSQTPVSHWRSLTERCATDYELTYTCTHTYTATSRPHTHACTHMHCTCQFSFTEVFLSRSCFLFYRKTKTLTHMHTLSPPYIQTHSLIPSHCCTEKPTHSVFLPLSHTLSFWARKPELFSSLSPLPPFLSACSNYSAGWLPSPTPHHVSPHTMPLFLPACLHKQPCIYLKSSLLLSLVVIKNKEYVVEKNWFTPYVFNNNNNNNSFYLRAPFKAPKVTLQGIVKKQKNKKNTFFDQSYVSILWINLMYPML